MSTTKRYVVNVDVGYQVGNVIHPHNSVVELDPDAAKEAVESGRLIASDDKTYLTDEHQAILKAHREAAKAAKISGPVVDVAEAPTPSPDHSETGS